MVREVHRAAHVVDTHCDTLGRVFEGQRRLGDASKQGQFDLPRARQGGLTAEVMATFVDDRRPGSALQQSIDFIDVFHRELDAFGDLARLALTGSDVRRAKDEGRVALILGMEGAEGLGGSLAALRTFHRLGLRVLGVTWNRRNEAADGMGEEATGGGLTRFGRDLVAACDDLGILLDLSHLAPRGVDDVLQIAERPVVATHANARGLHDHPRNLSDRQLDAIASTGGVIGVVAVPPFLGRYETVAPADAWFDHLDYIVARVGVDHVGIGMDFDGVGAMRTEGLETVAELPAITRGLLERGYEPSDVTKILGGNFLRVFDAVFGDRPHGTDEETS